MTVDLLLAFAHIFAFIGVACFVAVVATAVRK